MIQNDFDYNLFSLFSGECLEGYICYAKATTKTPLNLFSLPGNGPCPAGHYCTNGTTATIPCPLGTVRKEPGNLLSHILYTYSH